MVTAGVRHRDTLSLREARRASLVSQGLMGTRWKGGPSAMLQRLRGVQLDTISVLARSHELVAYARLGAIGRDRIEKAYWGGPPFGAFEYWAHAACVVPMEDWPYFEYQRRARRARGRRWHRLENADRVGAEVLAKLRSDGPLTAKQLGGAKRGGVWWDWSETKIAVEWLLDIGDVVCTSRRGFQRVYDLPERAVPDNLLGLEVEEHVQVAHLLARASEALGVATAGDLAAYCGASVRMAAGIVPDLGLVPVAVEDWKDPAWAAPSALAHLEPGRRFRRRAVLLSPFDPTLWFRPRVERLFGFHHRLEAYVPAHQRVHGYFSMPVLAGDMLVGRVDPGREGDVLVAKAVHLEPGVPLRLAATATAEALDRAASWVGATSVALRRVEPAEARSVITASLGGGPSV